MSSGQKAVQVNTQERAVSPDVNRLQAFKAAAMAEFFRSLIDVDQGFDDTDAAALATATVSLTNPITAEVINGLMVTPVAGTVDLLVTPGVAYFINPDGGLDDSVYKYVNDPGVPAPIPALQIPANGGGSPVISIIECQWTNVVSETDNRDVYNVGLNAFVAATVTKATQGALVYRVRSGTVGGGFASVTGSGTGWLPLAVASAPAGSVNNNTVTFWDVRPLVNDRVFGLSKTARTTPRQTQCVLKSDGAGAPSTDLTLSGLVEVDFKGRRLGGRIRRGTPGVDADSIVIGPTTTANLDPAIAFGVGGYQYLYFLTPFGLPRWARYTDGPAGRVPRSPRGIPVLSTVVALPNGVPSTAVALPTSTGLAGSTTEGVAAVVTVSTDTTHLYPINANGREQYLGANLSGTLPAFNAAFSKGIAGNTTSISSWVLTAGVDFPANAKRIFVTINLSTTGAANPGVMQRTVRVFWPNDTVNVAQRAYDGGLIQWASTNRIDTISTWIPIPQIYPSLAPGYNITIDVPHLVLTAMTSTALYVLGWEF